MLQSNAAIGASNGVSSPEGFSVWGGVVMDMLNGYQTLDLYWGVEHAQLCMQMCMQTCLKGKDCQCTHLAFAGGRIIILM